jgi:CDP-diacylglycerol--glycerol-3-phosphate 3-phosphatidyltransferase
MKNNLPNWLTLGRMLAIPLLVAIFFMPIPFKSQNLFAMWLFIAAGVTDWVDGYLARKWGQTTPFGAFLDPVADKLLVCTALILLVQLGRIDVVIASIIVGREITVSALREWMAQLGQSSNVAVNTLGKFKTAAQLCAIPMLLYFDHIWLIDFRTLGYGLLVIAAILTVWSMLYYLRRAWPYLKPQR